MSVTIKRTVQRATLLRYVIRYGIAWRAMPNDFPPWAAVYQQSQRWLALGCFETLAQDLRAVRALLQPPQEQQACC